MMQEYSSSYGSSNYSEEGKGVKHCSSMLHSVRKSIAKPCKKAPVAPPVPQTPIKVYKVDPINFRDLVQHLTGAPQFMPQAPPPPPLHFQTLTPFTSTAVSSFVDAEPTMGMGLKAQQVTASELPELNLSSPSYNWCSSFPPLTPETMTTWELPGRVL